MLSNSHLTMQNAMINRRNHRQRRAKSGKGKGKDSNEEVRPEVSSDFIFHQAPEDQCTICQMIFSHNDDVVRVRCGHVFHYACFSNYKAYTHQRSGVFACPNFKGNPVLIARFKYVGLTDEPEQQEQAPAESGASSWIPVPTQSSQRSNVYMILSLIHI